MDSCWRSQQLQYKRSVETSKMKHSFSRLCRCITSSSADYPNCIVAMTIMQATYNETLREWIMCWQWWSAMLMAMLIGTQRPVFSTIIEKFANFTADKDGAKVPRLYKDRYARVRERENFTCFGQPTSLIAHVRVVPWQIYNSKLFMLATLSVNNVNRVAWNVKE